MLSAEMSAQGVETLSFPEVRPGCVPVRDNALEEAKNRNRKQTIIGDTISDIRKRTTMFSNRVNRNVRLTGRGMQHSTRASAIDEMIDDWNNRDHDVRWAVSSGYYDSRGREIIFQATNQLTLLCY